ncbi:MAG: ABC transporter ATP-binding protein [Caldilineaceae bacterium]|nr:ABC transporter ATP-binding protein [Caldilineaceae bacterium]
MATVNDAGPVFQIENLNVHYGAGRQRLNAVNGLSLTIGAGQTVAIVGESGSGKSSAAMALVNGLAANGEWDADRIVFQGQEISRQELMRLRGRAITYMMQDPSSALNPVLTIGEQIKRVLKYHTSLSSAEREDQAIELMERVEIPDAASRLNAYPHEFSGGMQQRIVLAIALAPSPVLLIADEPTTGLDVTVEAQIYALLERLKRELTMSVVLVAHDLGVVATSADEALVLYAGKVVESGSVASLFRRPRHPYTLGLLRCAHDLHEKNVLNPIPGRIPGLGERPHGCVFHPRCAWKTDECEAADPELIQLDGQSVACIHHENL